jgi:predicted aspartyl protease
MHFRMINLVILAAAFILSTAMATAEGIYTWTDENGVRHMSNMEPVEFSGKIEIMELKPAANSEEPRSQYSQPVSPPATQHETKVKIIDNHVIVPVTLLYKKKRVRARLLLDTGSTNITLHKDIANKLSIKKPQKGSIRVAGGELIDAEAVILDSVTVGPHTKKGLVAGIIEHNGPDVAFDGLLGMNFLKNYQYAIDFENQMLRWNQ